MNRTLNRKTVYTCALIGLAAALFASGCGGETQTPTAAAPPKPGTRTYARTPAAASELLKDTSLTLAAKAAGNTGVHFRMEASTTVNGQVIISHGEGDMIFPDRQKMTMTTYINNQPLTTEVIAIEGKVYTKSGATGGNWSSSPSTTTAVPDLRSTASYLDFARSSRIIGEDNLRGVRKTYHIQVDVDSFLAAAEAMKKTTDPATQQELEKTRSATVVVDFWIGVDDLLIYQEVIKISNPAAGLNSNQTFTFSDWGKAVTIEQPCAAC